MVKTSIKHLKSRLKHLHAEPPPVSKHPVRFNGRKSSERRSINFSNYHLSLHWSHDQIVMQLQGLWSLTIRLTLSSLVFSKWRYVFNLSYDHLIEEPCEFKGGRSSRYFTTLINHFNNADISLNCHVISREHMFKCLKDHVNLWVEGPRNGSPLCYVQWPLVQCKQRYKVFKISQGFTKPRD